ncbi:MAG TPA: type IX secretion system membrane protein PorP/SprF [Dinghuibacter sp.]|uniref:PorP/SprF family type IX secretion system membrane protein n=1 Tax=Dinghuibacter sp. TaxID=2024697 RepID=UPI002CA6515D|nr:type IX secretion system membrane protein PorP/SprF [Dinghuibacter sp.]HTJ12673.1 type IX secretion system membrane protein PorP/SprF [Dinghuibacter sp.]
MNPRLVILLLAITLVQKATAQQDIQFSQYVFNGLSLNPAYAGYKGQPYLNANFRDQWAGFPGAPKTGVLSLDGVTDQENDRMGLGVQLLYDQLGPQKNYSLTGDYAYRIPLNDDEDDPHRLCLGLAGVASQYSLNGSVLTYTDPNDPTIPQVQVRTKIVPDASFGVYYYTNHFYAGASLLNLFSINSTRTVYYANGSEYADILQSAHLYATVGGMIELSDEVKMKPSVLFKEDFRGPTNADFNVLFLLDELVWVGGSYRSAMKLWQQHNLQQNLEATDAASLMVEFFATPNLRIGYSYDFTTSGLSNYQTGSHELSVGILFSKRKPNQYDSPRYF